VCADELHSFAFFVSFFSRFQFCLFHSFLKVFFYLRLLFFSITGLPFDFLHSTCSVSLISFPIKSFSYFCLCTRLNWQLPASFPVQVVRHIVCDCGVIGTEAGGAANSTADILGGWGTYLNQWSGLV